MVDDDDRNSSRQVSSTLAKRRVKETPPAVGNNHDADCDIVGND